jgi:hypothetical protein
MGQDALSQLITANRDNAPDPLELCLPLDRALDEVWCSTASSSILKNKKWKVKTATQELGEFLPDKTGIYMFVWRLLFPMPTELEIDHKFRYVLYVGKAGGEGNYSNIQKRYVSGYSKLIGAHPEDIWKRDATERDEVLRRFLAFKELEYWYIEIENTNLIDAHEQTLIKLFNPPGNTQHVKLKKQLVGKIQQAIPAF